MKLNRKIFFLIGFYLTLTLFKFKGCESNSELLSGNPLEVFFDPLSNTSSNDINFDDSMRDCNESFRIPLDYLQDFNTITRFPDESDRTPMCYIRCYLQITGMIVNGKVNKTRIQELWWPVSDENIENCQKEGVFEESQCMAVYNISRCLMLKALIDGRNVKLFKI